MVTVELIPLLAPNGQVDEVLIRSQKGLSFRKGHLERSSDFWLRDTPSLNGINFQLLFLSLIFFWDSALDKLRSQRHRAW